MFQQFFDFWSTLGLIELKHAEKGPKSILFTGFLTLKEVVLINPIVPTSGIDLWFVYTQRWVCAQVTRAGVHEIGHISE